MIVNSSLTVYHKDFDEKKRIDKWIRFNYGDKNKKTIWWHGGKGASTEAGYENANDVKIRIPYKLNENLDIKNFKIGDILIKGYIDKDILTLQDLSDVETYSVMLLIDNLNGGDPHIRIGGK